MPEAALADIRRALADIAKSILRLPESRPSQLPSVGAEAIRDLVRACDLLIAALSGPSAQDLEAGELLMDVRAYRRLLFLALAEATPDQARLWTEDYKEQERTVSAQIAAGLRPRFYKDETFEEKLRAQWLGEAGA